LTTFTGEVNAIPKEVDFAKNSTFQNTQKNDKKHSVLCVLCHFGAFCYVGIIIFLEKDKRQKGRF
jgi:hypothetical protein